MANDKDKLSFGEMLKTQKKWWITPILIVLILLIAFLVFGKHSKIAPFIYERF